MHLIAIFLAQIASPLLAQDLTVHPQEIDSQSLVRNLGEPVFALKMARKLIAFEPDPLASDEARGAGIYNPETGVTEETQLILNGIYAAGYGGAFTFDGRHLVSDTPEFYPGSRWDGNQDGDIHDSVLQFYDLQNGGLKNTGLAIPSNSALGRGMRVSGDVVLAAVREGSQGQDLNGDGDLADEVLWLLQMSTGVQRNLGYAVRANHPDYAVCGSSVAFSVREAAQGLTDLNGDGDTLDSVLFVYNILTGEFRNLGVAASIFWLVEERLAIGVLEDGQSSDLNGDGDLGDWVLHTYDFILGQLTNQMLAVGIQGGWSADGELYGFDVLEADQGSLDRNGDGDAEDHVLAVFDFGDGSVESLGYAVTPSRLFVGAHDVLAIVSEADQSLDLDGDGEANDLVPVIFDLVTGFATPLGFATREYQAGGLPDFPTGETDAIIFLVQEAEQDVGGVDLNGDGDFDDLFGYMYNPWTKSLAVLPGALRRGIGVGTDRLAYDISEAAEGSDLNGDGDAIDFLTRAYDRRSGDTSTLDRSVLRHFSFNLPPLVGDFSFFFESEIVEQEDLNGDGDLKDENVAAVYDFGADRLHRLGLAWADLWSFDFPGDTYVFDGETLAFTVNEPAQGKDLDGDGEVVSRGVLHVVRMEDLRRGHVEPSTLLAAQPGRSGQ